MGKLQFLNFLNRIKCLNAENGDNKDCPFIHSSIKLFFNK